MASGVPGRFVVSRAKLARIMFPWRGRKKPPVAVPEAWAVRRAEPGGLVAVLLLPGSVGKLVHIESPVTELDWSAVSSSVGSNPFFSRDGPQPLPSSGARRRSRMSAWHAVRVHHHCRLMGVPEACCERVGSVMKRVWGKNPSASVSTLMDITYLAAAGVECSGTARDEQLCQSVAEAMVMMGRAPTLSKRSERNRSRQGINVSRAVTQYRREATAALIAAGRGCGFDSDEHASDVDGPLYLDAAAEEPASKRSRAARLISGGMGLPDLTTAIRRDLSKSKPAMQLPVQAQKKLDDATANGVAALPLWHTRRGTKKASTPSGIKARLASWMDSEAGKEWKLQRDQRIRSALNAE